MKIIEKIEIKYFRSFGVKTEIVNLKNLNIFSGGNDSGKSNILRALNLFFNYNEPDFVFSIAEDFSEIEKSRQKDLKKKTNIIEITVHFFSETRKHKKANRSDKFAIRRQFDKDGFRGQTYILKKELEDSFFQKIVKEISVDSTLKKEVKVIKDSKLEINIGNTDFLGKSGLQVFKTKKSVSSTINRIEYYYVPAIRSRVFFQKMIRKFISRVQESFDDDGHSSLTKRMSEVEKSLEDYSKIFFSHVPFLGKEPKFKVPKNLNTFFSQFDIGTGDGNHISFKNRGDGIQAHLVPEFLHFLSSKIIGGKLERPTGKYFIWAFEEPENSCEYLKAQEIADLFIKYSGDKENNQIFITSHAFNFLGIIGDDVCLYRVFKDGDNSAVFGPIPNEEEEKNKQLKLWKLKHLEREKLEQEIGVPELMKKMSENFRIEMEEKKLLEEKVEKLAKDFSNATKPLLAIEDKYDQIYKIAWLKLNDIEYQNNEQDIEQKFNTNASFSIWGAESAKAVAGFLRVNNTKLHENKKIIGLFDFDKEGSENFYHLKNGNNWCKEISGELKSGFYKKRNQHPCFYALLLPIPDKLKNLVSSIKEGKFVSFVEIENLLPQKFLENKKFCVKETVLNQEYLKIYEDKKDKIWSKLAKLSKDDFKNFEPLFKIIEKLFNL